MAESVEIRDRARQWYIDRPLATLRDVAGEFGIPYETIRDWSKTEGWSSRRILEGNMDDEQALLEAGGMRNVIYETIASGDASSGDLPNLVKAWMALYSVRRPPETEEQFDRDALLS